MRFVGNLTRGCWVCSGRVRERRNGGFPPAGCSMSMMGESVEEEVESLELWVVRWRWVDVEFRELWGVRDFIEERLGDFGRGVGG